ncbi:hypothetical protein PYK79_42310 [Streptomyces sp. ID05-04B]|uniref:hypothetical protein n=1 Tax=Streptomyces sp. ID05-04B TaxID=3028661 RepID=UPI0029C4B7DB|nr:hypothetical protein [Streptomyces sp. ID05-04B]MDX5568626.1 hypothetical protein [Streptomyces sp. ID05-04B]
MSAVTAEPVGHPGPWPELLHPTPSAPFEGVRSYLDVPYAVSPGFRPLVLGLHLPDDGRRAARPVAGLLTRGLNGRWAPEVLTLPAPPPAG